MSFLFVHFEIVYRYLDIYKLKSLKIYLFLYTYSNNTHF
jgi:hypothetical protein